MTTIKVVPNWINGEEFLAKNNLLLDKYNPHNGELISQLADSSRSDVEKAVSVAENAFYSWAELSPVSRGQMLADMVSAMKRHSHELADCVALETGKPPQDARGEVAGAILQAEFWAGEGMRLYGRSLTSGMPGKNSHTIRQPRGVAGLIVPSNTPIANIAWKTFPALVCGNTVVLKAAEDSPHIALLFAQITKESGLPDGVFNVVQGQGKHAGAALVEDPRVAIVSFTGSTEVGRWIAEVGGRRLARVSVELGGKNPLVVCDDADLDHAVHWSVLSAFSNAGQRCASGSRILVFEGIYEKFREKFLVKAKGLKLGTSSGCDLGPVINQRQQKKILAAIDQARAEGGNILCGGSPPCEPQLATGFYVEPTIVEGLKSSSNLCSQEIFGPVATLHPVTDLKEALSISNDTEYGLTAAIHTVNVDRAMWFAQRVRVGVVNINLGTYGSEPHMPFGGFGASGNGTREPGIEALDVYTEIKNISFFTRENLI
jgi:acyl-CoA reductase-like NAD-dependent aldehyde dehydrogenase